MNVVRKQRRTPGDIGTWNMSLNEKFEFGNLGINAFNLAQTVGKMGGNNVFVDLGVDFGTSSLCMSYEAIEKNNNVYGVDTQFNRLDYSLRDYANYHMILGDSSSVGKYWDVEKNGKVDLLFVDTIHVAVQVATELYYWWPHMQENSYIVFHDTNWPEGRYDLTWHPEVQRNNIRWERPEVAVGRFFDVLPLFEQYGNEGFIYDDEFININHSADSWGLTTVQIKKKKDYRKNIGNWDQIFQGRNTVVGYFESSPGAFVLKDIREEDQ